ncbi:diacylglycerol kinase family protein [Chitinophaga sp. GCM10012297]|uniref:Diacylglycerol kinase family protein n=1 Tax=Chitinophaga chungangae TaxID=2821488 RepID=A0ABS3YD53_9BACT|nr:diacylglycerol kinase family protein [Chitinophaga chungangae]MBO9152612.1 diacylglycerol kinase family protein [Chitinophaga chungangae]
MSVQKRFFGIRHAFNGLGLFLRSESNGRIHTLATLAVIALAAWLGCSAIEWAMLALVIAMVWITEMLNTAIEKIMDYVQPDIHPKVKWIKDVSAGAVLVAAIAAIITGALVLLPKLMAL